MGKNNSFNGIRISQSPSDEVSHGSIDIDTLSLDKQTAIRFKQDIRHRHWLVLWMMVVVSAWLALVLVIVMFNLKWCLYIHDNVLITLLATTTINVLGLSKIILHGLFKSNKHLHNRGR